MAYCCSFIGDEGSTLVVGTERGELLVWEVSKFWVSVLFFDCVCF